MRVVCESECVVEPLGWDGTAVLRILVKRLQSSSVLLLHVKSVADHSGFPYILILVVRRPLSRRPRRSPYAVVRGVTKSTESVKVRQVRGGPR
eukprot:4999074-Prymnesium_polylepis.1